MEKYSVFNTPFNNIITVKYNIDNISFRPASTGNISDIALLNTKCLMEDYEDRILGSSIASAAHYDDTLAKQNALNEFIERCSVASWWHYRSEIENAFCSRDNDFNIYQGYIKSVFNMGKIAVCILENSNSYPYLTLGSSYNTDIIKSKNNAYLESVQSWVGSNWMRENGKPIFWDLSELKLRADQIKSTNFHIDERYESGNVTEEFTIFEYKRLGDIALARVKFKNDEYNQYPGDFLRKIHNSEPIVFSKPNY